MCDKSPFPAIFQFITAWPHVLPSINSTFTTFSSLNVLRHFPRWTIHKLCHYVFNKLIRHICLWLYIVNGNNFIQVQVFNIIVSMIYMWKLTIIHTTLCISNFFFSDYHNRDKLLILALVNIEYPLRSFKTTWFSLKLCQK